MTDIEQRIEKLRELDNKRTPGSWEAGVHPANPRLNIIKPICFGKYVGKLPECEGGAMYFLDAGTAQFIAAAPEMMQVIEELQRKLDVAKRALEIVRESPEWIGMLPKKKAVINQALAEINKGMGSCDAKDTDKTT